MEGTGTTDLEEGEVTSVIADGVDAGFNVADSVGEVGAGACGKAGNAGGLID